MFLRSNWQNSLGLLIQCFIYGCSPIHTTTVVLFIQQLNNKLNVKRRNTMSQNLDTVQGVLFT